MDHDTKYADTFNTNWPKAIRKKSCLCYHLAIGNGSAEYMLVLLCPEVFCKLHIIVGST
jgi:hypothetical protein